MTIEWTDKHICCLINERKNRNEEYHKIAGKRRVEFWNSVANKINRKYRIIYIRYQCQQKFNSLVKNYNVCKFVK